MHDWEGIGKTGAFRAPRFLAFHHEALPALLDAGALELLWLTVRGEPVAATYDIVWNDKVYFYQSGRRTALPTAIRPGGALLAYALRAAIEAGRREFDFLDDVSRSKTQLATGRRPLVQLRFVRPCLIEGLRRAADAGTYFFRQCHRHVGRLRSANKQQRRRRARVGQLTRWNARTRSIDSSARAHLRSRLKRTDHFFAHLKSARSAPTSRLIPHHGMAFANRIPDRFRLASFREAIAGIYLLFFVRRRSLPAGAV